MIPWLTEKLVEMQLAGLADALSGSRNKHDRSQVLSAERFPWALLEMHSTLIIDALPDFNSHSVVQGASPSNVGPQG